MLRMLLVNRGMVNLHYLLPPKFNMEPENGLRWSRWWFQILFPFTPTWGNDFEFD